MLDLINTLCSKYLIKENTNYDCLNKNFSLFYKWMKKLKTF